AVFLDRDGTLIEESGYLDRLDRLIIYPFAVDAVRLLNRAGFRVIVISNQSGVGRGLIRESFVAEAHAHICEYLKAGGASLDAFYYCPHHPDATIAAFRQCCECRKPGAGMLTAAAAEHGLDLARSFVVGDRWDDVGAARAAGAKGVLVRTGYGRAAETSPRPDLSADRVTGDLAGAVAWILAQA
ncbi:MAG: D-glycero-alpha-D-manno-heptose-1,7-bisphosphate 7-phosphatase, partial [Gemmatimonadales bacterium]